MSAEPAVVVAGHICLDVIPSFESDTPLDPGRLVRVGAAEMAGGGAVANVGIALHRLGIPVRLMGMTADDLFGRALLDMLRRSGSDLAEGMRVSTTGSTSYSIVINPPGRDRTFLHCPGLNETFSADDVAYDRIAPARLFHFGYPPLMPAMCAGDGESLVRMFRRVRELGVATSLDMCAAGEGGRVNWPRLLQRVLPHVDVFLPSLDEILFMLDRKGEHPCNLSALAGRLLDLGVAVAGLKLGDQGLFLRASADESRIGDFARRVGLTASEWIGREIHSPCFRAERVAGTTGSGDCTIAGFLAAMVHGAGAVDAATHATAVGACSVEAIDATSGVQPWSAVQRRLESGWPRLPLERPPRNAMADALGTFVIDGRA